MEITKKAWDRYIKLLRKVSDTAADQMKQIILKRQVNTPRGRALAKEVAQALVDKYGAASGALACRYFEEVAKLEGVKGVDAEMVDPRDYVDDLANKLDYRMNRSEDPDYISQAVEEVIKMIVCDTTLKNCAAYDAEWAWIPQGSETCAFCITLASNGWKTPSARILKGQHAEHIHANCDCQFAIRFTNETKYEDYDPDKYLAMYNNAEGYGSKGKIQALRRDLYAQRKDKINAQKRAAYAARKAREH